MARPRKIPALDSHAGGADDLGLPDALIKSIDPTLPKTAQVCGIIRPAIVGLVLHPGGRIFAADVLNAYDGGR